MPLLGKQQPWATTTQTWNETKELVGWINAVKIWRATKALKCACWSVLEPTLQLFNRVSIQNWRLSLAIVTGKQPTLTENITTVISPRIKLYRRQKRKITNDCRDHNGKMKQMFEREKLKRWCCLETRLSTSLFRIVYTNPLGKQIFSKISLQYHFRIYLYRSLPHRLPLSSYCFLL